MYFWDVTIKNRTKKGAKVKKVGIDEETSLARPTHFYFSQRTPDNGANTINRTNPVFFTNVAQKWLSMGCQKNFDRVTPGELVNF